MVKRLGKTNVISADTNVFVDYFRGIKYIAVDTLQKALEEKYLLMNPFVLSELLSSPKMTPLIEKYLLALPRLEITLYFFERSGLLRRKIYKHGKGVSIADIYIAQVNIDANVPLLTRDDDFKTISNYSHLKIYKL